MRTNTLPLPPPQTRTHLHHRKVDYNGYLRDDGLWDIEARVTDTRTYAIDAPGRPKLDAGLPVHDMLIRATVDDAMTIQEISAVMESRPFGECMQAQAPMQKMVGATMGPGWRQAIEKALGGIQSCAHLRELLFNMATAAYQTIPVYRAHLAKLSNIPPDATGKPPHHLGKCVAWDFNGSVVLRNYPQFAGWQKLPDAGTVPKE